MNFVIHNQWMCSTLLDTHLAQPESGPEPRVLAIHYLIRTTYSCLIICTVPSCPEGPGGPPPPPKKKKKHIQETPFDMFGKNICLCLI